VIITCVFGGFAAIVALAVWLTIRKLRKANAVVLVTKTDAARSRARAEAAEHTATRTFGVAESALDVAGQILLVDAKVDVVDEKVTELLEHAGKDLAPLGRHARGLHVVRDHRRNIA
jgi:hypothetical protein